MTQIFISRQLPVLGTLARFNRSVVQTYQRHSLGRRSLPSLLARKKFPWHIGKAFAFCPSDSVSDLRVETHFSNLVHILRVQGVTNILLKHHVTLRADGGLFPHGRADAVSRQMP